MTTEHENQPENLDIPASLRHRKKEPQKMIQVRIPLSQWEELAAFARDYDQDISTFLREAIEDWLKRARKVREVKSSTPKPPAPEMPY
jgi:hypothetical protein